MTISETISPPEIDLGIIVAGPLDVIDREAINLALADIQRQMNDWLPEFAWRLPLVRRDEWVDATRVEPTDLLSQAREERDAQLWDFAIVLTAADLISHYKPFALAVISRSLDVAIASTSRIDPRASDPSVDNAIRQSELKHRIERIVLHAFGHWAGLGHDESPTNIMSDIRSVATLSDGNCFSDEQVRLMRESLVEIADRRLEEREELRNLSTAPFYTLAAWHNRGEILDAIVQAKPWEFPTRLSRLTTASVSAVLVLLMTAETWDMATSQTGLRVGILFCVALSVTTSYVAVRQQLLLRRSGHQLSEQIVTTNVSAVGIVAAGMITLFVLLFLVTLTASTLLFPTRVVSGWAASVVDPLSLKHYLLMAGTVGSLGIMIGALGASFEQHNHFRHVIFVDEEV